MNLFDLVAVLTLNKQSYEEGLNEATKDASTFGSKLKSGIGTATKVAGATLAVVGAAATKATKSFIDMSNESAQLADHIDKQSQKIGISAEAYQEWDFILTHNGASVDSLQASMKTLATQAEKNADEFAALGITEQELAELSPEELFERIVKELQSMENGTERTAVASKLLGRAATELAPVFNSTSEEIEEMRQQAHDLGKVLSDDAVKAGAAYEDSLYNLKSAIGGIKNKIGTDFLPSIVTVMDGLTGLFAGDDSAIGKLEEGIVSFADKITESIPRVASVATNIIVTIGKSIVKSLPQITQAAISIVKNIVKAISDNLDTVVDVAIDVVMALVDGLIEAVPTLIEGAVNLVLKVVEKLPTIIEKLIEAIPKVITMLIDGFFTNFPQILSGLIELVLKIVADMPTIIKNLLDDIPNIISKLIEGFIGAMPQIVQGAIELITGLVTHIPEIIKGLIDAIPGILSSILSAFGPLGEMLATLFGGFLENVGGVLGGLVDIAGGVLGEVGNIAQGVFSWMGTLMDDPAQALEDAFDGIKNYASKVFESVKTIVSGIFDFIDAKQKEAEAKANREKADAALQETIDNGKLKAELNEYGTHDYTDEYKEYLTAKGLLGGGAATISESTTWEQWQARTPQTIDIGGKITVEGVNDEGEFVASANYIMNEVKQDMRR